MQSIAAISFAAERDGRLAERARIAAILNDERLAGRPAEIVLAIDLAVRWADATGQDCVDWVIEHCRPQMIAEFAQPDRYAAQVDAGARRARLTVIEGGR